MKLVAVCVMWARDVCATHVYVGGGGCQFLHCKIQPHPFELRRLYVTVCSFLYMCVRSLSAWLADRAMSPPVDLEDKV